MTKMPTQQRKASFTVTLTFPAGYIACQLGFYAYMFVSSYISCTCSYIMHMQVQSMRPSHLLRDRTLRQSRIWGLLVDCSTTNHPFPGLQPLPGFHDAGRATFRGVLDIPSGWQFCASSFDKCSPAAKVRPSPGDKAVQLCQPCYS